MNPGRLIIAYLAAPVGTALLFMSWSALSGGFNLSDLKLALFLCCIPHLGATISWIPIVILREPSRLGRWFYLGAGALSGIATAVIGAALSFGEAHFYLWFTITGAISALIFREISATRAETI